MKYNGGKVKNSVNFFKGTVTTTLHYSQWVVRGGEKTLEETHNTGVL